MSQQEWFMTLSGEVSGAINTHYAPRLEKWIREDGIQGRTMFIAQTAVSFAPNPLTVQDLIARTPYMSVAQAESNLEDGVEDGVLAKVGEQAYKLTDAGTAIATAVPKMARELAAGLQPLPADDAEQLAGLLRAVVDTAVASNLPDKTSILTSRKFDPGNDAPVVERIRRYLNDLAAYRDDAHVAAWRAYGLDGHEWEAFSHVHGEFVFDDPVTNGEELAEKLSGFRGYDAAAYDEALQKVAALGWLQNGDGKYAVTEKGNEIRTAVEAETDRLFFVPWATVSDEDAAEMQTLLTSLRDALQPPSAQQVWQTSETAYQALAGTYWPALQEKNKEIGFEGWDLFLTRRAAVLEDGLTLAFLIDHFPYDAPQAIQLKLDTAVSHGFIAGTDSYQPAAKGLEGSEVAMDCVEETLRDLSPLAKADTTQLLALLTKLTEAIVTTEVPAQKVTTLLAHKMIGDDADVLHQISQQIGILNAFREDVHLAAWRSLVDVPGRQWEAFSHVWGENVWGDPVNTAAELAEKLEFRGYALGDYTAVLQDCVARGWLAEADGTYTITETGNDLRQKAEDETDALFYTPWATLRDSERLELNDLLTQLSEALQPTPVES